MSAPSNPFEIIIRNRFYPSGLTEQEIYNYWLSKKFEILKNLLSSHVILYLAPSENQQIIRRYASQGQPIILNDQNYEKVLNGRIIGILNVFGNVSDEGIIDIDTPKEEDSISSEQNFQEVKKITKQVYQFFSKRFPSKLFFTGKNGFHIRCQLPRKMIMEKVKLVLSEVMKGTPMEALLTNRNLSSPNIDLSPNMKNGGFILEGSLNVIGLPCVEIDPEQLEEFKRENLIRKVYEDITKIKTHIPLNPKEKSSPNMYRQNLKPGMEVEVAEKKNYSSGILTKGKIEKILTNKSYHPRGIKVMLDSGIVGRVQKIC